MDAVQPASDCEIVHSNSNEEHSQEVVVTTIHNKLHERDNNIVYELVQCTNLFLFFWCV